jgi:hypothetical protein
MPLSRASRCGTGWTEKQLLDAVRSSGGRRRASYAHEHGVAIATSSLRTSCSRARPGGRLRHRASGDAAGESSPRRAWRWAPRTT